MLTRREIGLWIGSVLCARFVLTLVHMMAVHHQDGTATAGFFQYVSWLVLFRTVGETVNFFQYFAWFVLFRVLADSRALGPARTIDLSALILCTLCAVLPGDNAIWAAMTVGAAYFWFTRD